MKKITIRVTKADIRKARREIRAGADPSQNCVVGQSLQRRKGFSHVSVGFTTVSFRKDGEVFYGRLSSATGEYIRRFVARVAVGPRTVTITEAGCN